MSRLDLPWMKVSSRIADDPKITELIGTFGVEAFGTYVLLLSAIAREGDESASLKTAWNAGKTPISWLAKIIHAEPSMLPSLLDEYARLDLIDPTLWRNGVVAVPKFLVWHREALIRRENAKFGHLGGGFGKLGGRPTKPPVGVKETPGGGSEKPPVGQTGNPRVEKSRVDQNRVEQKPPVGVSNGKAIPLLRLKEIFNEEMTSLLGPVSEHLYGGNPERLRKPWQEKKLREVSHDYTEDQIRKAVRAAPDHPYHNGKGKDRTIRLSFWEVLNDIEDLLASRRSKAPDPATRPFAPFGNAGER